jgi:hypothetical protein
MPSLRALVVTAFRVSPRAEHHSGSVAEAGRVARSVRGNRTLQRPPNLKATTPASRSATMQSPTR